MRKLKRTIHPFKFASMQEWSNFEVEMRGMLLQQRMKAEEMIMVGMKMIR